MFTGDRSGEWLYRALHKTGFSNQPTSVSSEDKLRLTDCYITAAVRCAPPGNKPTKDEFRNCRPFLLEEVALLRRVKVVLGLGRIGFDAAIDAVCEGRRLRLSPRPRFSHGASLKIGGIRVLGSYHPSQQNTFTGRLTEPMFDAMFRKARKVMEDRS
jgi:uracil-DNA glycosylase family 4